MYNSRRRAVVRYVTGIEGNNLKKTGGLEKGKRQGETKQCDMQESHQTRNPLNIQLSDICSLSPSSSYYDSHVAQMLESQPQSEDFTVYKKTVTLEDNRQLNKLQAGGKSVNFDITTSSNESDSKIQSWISDPIELSQSPSLVANGDQRNSNKLSPSHVEYHSYLTGQLSELIAQFPYGINRLVDDTARSYGRKGAAMIDQIDCPEKDTDILLDNLRVLQPDILIQQFADEYESLSCKDKTVNVFNNAVMSNNRLSDHKEEMIKSYASNKQFCCILGWASYVSGQRLQCSCTSAKDTLTLAPVRKCGLDPLTKLAVVSHIDTELESCPLMNELNHKTPANKQNINSTDRFSGKSQLKNHGLLGPQPENNCNLRVQSKKQAQKKRKAYIPPDKPKAHPVGRKKTHKPGLAENYNVSEETIERHSYPMSGLKNSATRKRVK
ncbi:uncharacterized protein LOC142102071 [Mixophyes fleayi]|uniref:uncharacterized protein LOC142102071 n=1 Tax=Mixophyes fleayi TaxID=3061075 RepID=UPI003F4E01A7